MVVWAERGSTTSYVGPAGITVHPPPARVHVAWHVAWSEDAGLSWGSPSEVMRVRADVGAPPVILQSRIACD